MSRSSELRGKCPSELRGLRLKTVQGVKYCFSYSLGHPCKDGSDCRYAHGCMRCGDSRCSAKDCWTLKQYGYEEDEDFLPDTVDLTHDDEPSQTQSWKRPRYESDVPEPRNAPSSSSSQSLSDQVKSLQMRMDKQWIDLCDVTRQVKRMEKTLKHHGFDLDQIQREPSSSSEMD